MGTRRNEKMGKSFFRAFVVTSIYVLTPNFCQKKRRRKTARQKKMINKNDEYSTPLVLTCRYCGKTFGKIIDGGFQRTQRLIRHVETECLSAEHAKRKEHDEKRATLQEESSILLNGKKRREEKEEAPPSSFDLQGTSLFLYERQAQEAPPIVTSLFPFPVAPISALKRLAKYDRESATTASSSAFIQLISAEEMKRRAAAFVPSREKWWDAHDPAMHTVLLEQQLQDAEEQQANAKEDDASSSSSLLRVMEPSLKRRRRKPLLQPTTGELGDNDNTADGGSQEFETLEQRLLRYVGQRPAQTDDDFLFSPSFSTFKPLEQRR